MHACMQLSIFHESQDMNSNIVFAFFPYNLQEKETIIFKAELGVLA